MTQIEFTQPAITYLQKSLNQRIRNLILDIRQKRASCTLTIETKVYFKNEISGIANLKLLFEDENLKIFMNDEIIPLLEDPNRIIIDYKKGIFKKLYIKNANKKTQILQSCLIK